jgi:hypothetical protein
MSFELLDNILLESGEKASYVKENKKVDEPINEDFVPSETVLGVIKDEWKEGYRKGQLEALDSAVEACQAEYKKCEDDKCKAKWQKEIDIAKEGVAKNKAKMTKESTEDQDSEIINEEIEFNMDSMYADLDQLIENTMRTSLRTTITESAMPAETKLEHLTIVEKAIFTKEQMTDFVQENIDPILKCAGVFNGTYNLGGDNPVAVSLPVYEAALILTVANEGLLESANVKEDEKTIKNSLYESLMANQQVEKDNSKSLEIINEHLANLYDRYDMTEDNDREALFNEAVYVITKYGSENLRPSFNELAECVCIYNENAERNDEKLFGEVLPKEIDLVESDNVFVKALDRMNKTIPSLIPQLVKDKYKNVTENAIVNDSNSTIAIANTATGLGAMVAWREAKSENLEEAFNKAINVIKSQLNTCKNTSNEKICEACNNKLQEKWELELKEIGLRTVTTAAGAVGGAIGGNIGSRLNKVYKKMKTDLEDLKKAKADAKTPEDKEKIQKQIDTKISDMKKFRRSNTAVGAVGGAAIGAIAGGRK